MQGEHAVSVRIGVAHEDVHVRLGDAEFAQRVAQLGARHVTRTVDVRLAEPRRDHPDPVNSAICAC